MSEETIPVSILKALDKFQNIGLDELPAENLMERIDRKFTVSISEIGPFLEGLEGDYNIVKAAGSVIAPYRSLYLDTEDFKYFNKHRRGFSNRVKVRYRSYPKTDTTFLELKHKNNKGRTSKTRIPRNDFEYPLSEESRFFLETLLPAKEVEKLQRTVEVDYNRLGFIAKNGDERFSVDFDLIARYNGKEVDFGNLAIIEVKQDNYTLSPVIKQLRDKGIREASMSKYCMALSLLKPGLKWNIFKPTLHRIRKIDSETIYEI
jgi:hypothetical protein